MIFKNNLNRQRPQQMRRTCPLRFCKRCTWFRKRPPNLGTKTEWDGSAGSGIPARQVRCSGFQSSSSLNVIQYIQFTTLRNSIEQWRVNLLILPSFRTCCSWFEFCMSKLSHNNISFISLFFVLIVVKVMDHARVFPFSDRSSAYIALFAFSCFDIRLQKGNPCCLPIDFIHRLYSIAPKLSCLLPYVRIVSLDNFC